MPIVIPLLIPANIREKKWLAGNAKTSINHSQHKNGFEFFFVLLK